MRRAVEALFIKFPGIKHDITQAKQDPETLIRKIRKVCHSIFPPAQTHPQLYAHKHMCDYMRNRVHELSYQSYKLTNFRL